MKLTQFWQQLMLRLALIGAVLAVCGMWGGLVAPVSAESTALVRTIHALHGTRSVNVFASGSKVANNLQVASLTITDNASGSPQTVALSGSGTTASEPAVKLSPTMLSFGNQQVNTSSAVQTVTLKNSGNAALTINSIGLSGPNHGDFRQQNTCPSGSSTLAAGASCFINVIFTPTAEGSRSASLSIADNASGSPQTVALSGSGTTTSAAVVSLSPTSLSFGNQQVNTTSAVRAVTLTNSGNAALTINSIGLNGSNSGDFRQQNTCPSSSSTLAAGASCTINVTFTPSAESSRSASLTITDNASGSPQSVALSGTGVVGMPPTGSDPYAQPPADNTQQVPLRWLTLIVAVVTAAGIGTALISGRLRRSRPR
jgi:hypothetical protein